MTKSLQFLIPKWKGVGPNYYAIFDSYIEAVNQDLGGIEPDAEVFYTGRTIPNPSGRGTSKFIKMVLGIREFRGVPAFIAKWLGKPNPEIYTGKILKCNANHVISSTFLKLGGVFFPNSVCVLT